MDSELAQQILDLKAGSHLCLFYEKEPAEQMPALVPFIQDGLSRDEQFIYIADDQTVDELSQLLEQSGVNVGEESNRGALKLWTRGEWRQPDRLSSQKKSLQVKRIIEEAAKCGFKGSRFAVEMTWALGPDIEASDLEYWEATLNNIFVPGMGGRIACQYNRSRLSPEVLLAAFRTHPLAILGDHVYLNWFYEAPLILDSESSDARVAWMISVLERTHAAQKESAELIEKRIALLRAEVSKKEIDNILSLMPAGVYRCDEEGRITFFNRRAAELWGREPRTNDREENFCGSFRFWRPDGSPLPHAETPMAQAVETGKAARNQQVTMERPDGSRIVTNVNVSPLYGLTGDLSGTLNVFQDVTEAEKAEEISRRMAAIVESADDAIISKDMNGIITSWNEGAQRLFGYAAQEIIGKPVMILIPPERYEEEPGILNRIRHGDRVDHYETVRVRKDGSLVDISLTVSPIRDAKGNIIGASKIARDITERKQSEAALRQARNDLAKANEELERRVQERTAQLELSHMARIKDLEEQKNLEEQLRQAQKMESIGTLAGGIAHDFNNTLNIIRSYASTIGQCSRVDGEIAGDLKIIDEAVTRGASVVRQLLTFARKTEALLAPADVNEMVASLANLLKSTLPKTIDVSLELGAKLPSVLADANHLTQALLNLCVNARDAMPDGGKLILRTKVVDGANIKNVAAQRMQYVCLEVADSGIGMNDSIQNRIFEPFFTTKRTGEGTGLGLAMVYGMVKNHNGFVEVNSKPERGTTFKLYLPVAPSETNAIGDGVKRKKIFDGNHGNGQRTILVAEDEEAMALLLNRTLSKRGYKVLIARDGQEAINLYQQHKHETDLVLLDIGLPKVAGWDVIRKIKEMSSSINVIVSSGYLDPDLRAQLQQSGVKHFLDKPYTTEVVVETLQAVLEASDPSKYPD